MVPARKREWVIAVDAGHGGEDPGAIGRQYRTREKDVTLAVARELARQIDQEPGMRAVLIREGDYLVNLNRRWARAKHNDANLFISIHADAMPHRKLAYGSSVYAISDKGSTNALAAALVDQDNYSYLIGGVTLSDKEPYVKRTLMDLSREKKIEYSLMLGEDVLAELRQLGRVHSPRVAQAAFAVLKSVEIPSILVETAFITTPEEEKKLRDSGYQRQLASAILKGVKRYLEREERFAPPPSSAAAERFHIVHAGESLASIARQHNISVDALRFMNELASEELPVGLRLRLPSEGSGG